MPLDSTQTRHIPLPGGLADRARAAGKAVVYPPHAKRGGSSRHAGTSPEKHEENAGDVNISEPVVAQTTPPPRNRSKQTSPDMQAFLSGWVFDWLAVTIPNGLNGKGSRRAGLEGEREETEAVGRMFTWATTRGLHLMRVGKGADGYLGAAHLAHDPTGTERVATIRAGHSTNMPGLELPGAQGACAELAPLALEELGPVNVSRVDVCFDVSQEGLIDDLHTVMIDLAASRGMDAPRVDGTAEKGRTIYLGKDEAVVRVYQKDLERVSKGHRTAATADPNLVRVEVMLRPKKGKKAGVARIARDEGPGALLGVHLWIRQLMERFAVLTAMAREEAATMAVTRVSSLPDPRPLRERADQGARQYARVFCLAEIADLVQEGGGDWLEAELSPDEVLERAVFRIQRHLSSIVTDVCDRVGVLEARDMEAEATRAKGLLHQWMQEHHEATRVAQEMLMRVGARQYRGSKAPEAA